MNVQQLEVKLPCRPGADVVEAEAYIRVFHRWIREDRFERGAPLIDVADYRHVPDSPGIVLIAHGAHLRLETAGGEPGLALAMKRDAPGPLDEKLRDALAGALHAADLVEKEPELDGKVRFSCARVRVRVLSRLLAPNTPEAFAQLSAAIAHLAARLWPGTTARVEPVGAAREPLGALLHVDADETPAALLARLTALE